MAHYKINYNGKTYNKSQFLKEIGISDSSWRKYQHIAYMRLDKQGVIIHTDEEYYNKVIPATVELLLEVKNNMNKQSKIREYSSKKLDEPVVLGNKAFYTFDDIKSFIGSKEFNYEDYLKFRQSRKTAYSVQDFVAKLYRDNGDFKLRLMHALGIIDNSTYVLAVKCMNKYGVKNNDTYNEQYISISADDAIRMAYGIMNCNIKDTKITDVITNRWVKSQYLK